MKKFTYSIGLLTMILALAACGEAPTAAETTTVATETEAATTEAQTATEAAVPVFDNMYPEFILDETEDTVTYLDKFGQATTITKKPEKTVILYNSLLGLWYYMGGESIAKVKGSTNVPEEAMDLTDLGSYASISLEAVIALEPNLVIISGNTATAVEMAPSLNEMGIETMIIDAKHKPYERFEENAYLFAKVLGTEALYSEKTEPIIADVEAMVAKVKEAGEAPRVAPIFATSKSLSLESDIAQVGEIVAHLGGTNIYSEEDLLAEGETRIPFSIEALLSQNPEVILISTMGSVEKAQATVDAMIAENPAWQEVDAVKNGRVHYLDKNLSVYKPNQRYEEAFKMVAELLYPEAF